MRFRLNARFQFPVPAPVCRLTPEKEMTAMNHAVFGTRLQRIQMILNTGVNVPFHAPVTALLLYIQIEYHSVKLYT